jgi:MoaA/NifB/PqqE/SkfB family radical SAM enzyme
MQTWVDPPQASTYECALAFVRRHCEEDFFYLHLEPTNACNTVCEMCPRDAMSRPVEMMKREVFERLMALVLPSRLPMISIVGFGEPLLHRGLAEMVSFIRRTRADITLKLTTNGAFLSPATADRLYGEGLDFAELSVLGTTPELYARQMGGLSFSAMRRVVEYMQSRSYRFAVTTFESDDEDREAIIAYWQREGVRVHVKAMHRRGGYLSSSLVPLRRGRGDYRHRTFARASAKSSGCHKLHLFMHVNANGHFIPCVQEINDRNLLFHVNDVLSYEDIVFRLRSLSPAFDICSGCELKDQDLIEYYARFMAEYFPERIPDRAEGRR